MRIATSDRSPLTYMLGGEQLNVVSLEKDLGIVVDNQLKFHQHTASVASKVNRILGIFSKSFKYLDINSLLRLYKALVRPIVEYANSIWGPFYTSDQRMLEKVQKCASRLIVSSSRDLPYSERLAHLCLPSLYYRRRQGDMILVYQLLHGMLDVDIIFLSTLLPLPPTVYINYCRCHNFNLCKPRACNSFSNQVIND